MVAGALAAAVVAATTALVVAVSGTSSEPPRGAPAEQVRPGECAYRPVGEPVRVHPIPSFDKNRGFESVIGMELTVIGACRPTRGEPGRDTCGIGSNPIDTWIQVRSPYPGWIFEPCLRLRTDS